MIQGVGNVQTAARVNDATMRPVQAGCGGISVAFCAPGASCDRRDDVGDGIDTAEAAMRRVGDEEVAECVDRETVRPDLRRRRIVASALLALALWVSVPAVSAAVTGRSSRRADVADRYVVRAGDTLWSIAISRAPGSDPRRVVQAIVDSNQVDAGTLVPGQVLVIPA